MSGYSVVSHRRGPSLGSCENLQSSNRPIRLTCGVWEGQTKVGEVSKRKGFSVTAKLVRNPGWGNLGVPMTPEPSTCLSTRTRGGGNGGARVRSRLEVPSGHGSLTRPTADSESPRVRTPVWVVNPGSLPTTVHVDGGVFESPRRVKTRGLPTSWLPFRVPRGPSCVCYGPDISGGTTHSRPCKGLRDYRKSVNYDYLILPGTFLKKTEKDLLT